MSGKKLIIRRHVLAPMAAATVTGALLPLVSDDAGAEPQPMMQAARHTLIQAREQLQRATADRGGHRVRAIRLIEQALNEVEAGARVDVRR